MVDFRAISADCHCDGTSGSLPVGARPYFHGSTVALLLRELQAGTFLRGQKMQQTLDFITGAGGRD